MTLVKLDRRLWLTAGKDKVVEDGDPAAAFLWGVAGDEVDVEEAARLGYKARSQPANKQAPEPPNKSASTDDEDGDERDELTCECGFEAKNAAGLAAHQRSHE